MILLCKLLVTVVIGQTLFFKFSGAPESVYIFTQLGVEPWGRIALGMFELLAIALLWFPYTVLLGIGLVFCLMIGALASHGFVLGIEVLNDGGKLFFLAWVTLASDLLLIYYHRKELKVLCSTLS